MNRPFTSSKIYSLCSIEVQEKKTLKLYTTYEEFDEPTSEFLGNAEKNKVTICIFDIDMEGEENIIKYRITG